MLIPCARCGKPLDSPDNRNADYILTKDGTAIICVDCHRPGDKLIWGYHKERPGPGRMTAPSPARDLAVEIAEIKARLDRPGFIKRLVNRVRGVKP